MANPDANVPLGVVHDHEGEPLTIRRDFDELVIPAMTLKPAGVREHEKALREYWHELARHGNWSGPGRSFVPHAPAVDPEMLIDALKDAQDRAITTGRPERAAEYENARKALEQGAQASGPADPQNHAEAATAAGEGNHG